MENASKALIIAGAILLAILIISLGIMIFGQASGVVNNNAMSEVEMSTFNQKFEQYVSTRTRGANVNALLNAIRTNNEANSEDTSKQVELDSAGDIKATNVQAKTGSTYTVSISNYENGLVKKVCIKENTKATTTTTPEG